MPSSNPLNNLVTATFSQIPPVSSELFRRFTTLSLISCSSGFILTASPMQTAPHRLTLSPLAMSFTARG